MPRRRDEALAFIIDRLVQTGASPTYEEIGAAMRPRVGKTRAQQLVNQLIDAGAIEKVPGTQRALRVRRDGDGDGEHTRRKVMRAYGAGNGERQ